jgi:anti-sigma B factor antagonist
VRLLIVRQTDDVCLVRAVGEIDIQTVGELDSALTEIQGDGHAHVLLDLRDVTFIDAVGLGVLLSASRRAEKGAGGFAVVAEPHGLLHMVFDSSGLENALPLYATRALAISTLRSGVRV